MEETIIFIKDVSEKSIIDYLAIFSPIILSVVAIAISFWDSIWSRKVKNVEADMVWDDLLNSFMIIVQNTGSKSLIIDSISLIALRGKEYYELGTRNNAWAIRQDKTFINKNEAIAVYPIYDSVYDVFGYKGHAFDVNDKNTNLPVYLVVKDIKNKTWKIKTSFSLGEIDEKLEFATTVDR